MKYKIKIGKTFRKLYYLSMIGIMILLYIFTYKNPETLSNDAIKKIVIGTLFVSNTKCFWGFIKFLFYNDFPYSLLTIKHIVFAFSLILNMIIFRNVYNCNPVQMLKAYSLFCAVSIILEYLCQRIYEKVNEYTDVLFIAIAMHYTIILYTEESNMNVQVFLCVLESLATAFFSMFKSGKYRNRISEPFLSLNTLVSILTILFCFQMINIGLKISTLDVYSFPIINTFIRVPMEN